MSGAPRRAGLPTSVASELEGVARRTSILRVGFALCAIALLALAAHSSNRLGARATSYFVTGGGGVVVLDISTSVEPRKYQRIHRVLSSLTKSSARVGFVVFSDVAYEMLPPGTPGEELRPLLRFFDVPQSVLRLPVRSRSSRRGRGSADRGLPPAFDVATPWTGTFRGGTRISTGLREARLAIERDGVQPAVLLISDLDDSVFDITPLTQELIRYEGEGIRLRVVPLFAQADDRDLFERLVGEEAFVQNRELLRNTAIEERQTLIGSFPAVLALAAAALFALLALNERLCGRVSWRRG